MIVCVTHLPVNQVTRVQRSLTYSPESDSSLLVPDLESNVDIVKGKVHPCTDTGDSTGRTAHRGCGGIALLYRHGGSVRPIGGVEI